ncbi:MAG: hypothetical protein KA109_09040 [Saprospiraceae bacterium]|nr:hypothetical protein [Saprospiraceae bacterium]
MAMIGKKYGEVSPHINQKSLIFTVFMVNSAFLAVLITFLIGACIVAPKYSDIPEIELEGINKTVIDQGRVRDDSLLIRISFTDGDGDLGDPQNMANIFMIDDRDGKEITYSMPVIPQKGVNNGVAGTITILHTTLFNVCCYYANADPCSVPSLPMTDTVTYQLYIKDRSGNQSNIVTLPPLVINCK